jgi:hypothetical protein
MFPTQNKLGIHAICGISSSLARSGSSGRIKLFGTLIPSIYRDPVEISLVGKLKKAIGGEKGDMSRNKDVKRAFFTTQA